MNGSRLSFISAFVLLVLVAWPARAVVLPGEWVISGGYGTGPGRPQATFPGLWTFGNGSVVPLGTVSLNNSSIISGQFFYHFTPHFGLGMEFFDMTMTSGEYGASQGGMLSASISHKLFMVAARYVFMPERRWNPYAIGGAGIDDLAVSATGLGNPGGNSNCFGPGGCTTTPASVSMTHQALAVSAGFGIERSLTANLLAGVELGVIGIQKVNGGGDFTLSNEILPYLTARLGFNFGGVGRQ